MELVSWNDLAGWDAPRVRALLTVLGGPEVGQSLLRRETALVVLSDYELALAKAKPKVKHGRAELRLDKTNPVPFTQPFLVLCFDKADRGRMEWTIDVSGKIDEYIANFQRFYKGLLKISRDDHVEMNLAPIEVMNFRSQATPRLEEMIAGLANHNLRVDQVTAYVGSAGPSHVLMNGALFERMYFEDIDHVPRRRPHDYKDIASVYEEVCQKA